MLRQERTVLVYSDLLLGPSMTFVQAQAESLLNFVPYYVGARAIPKGGLHLPENRTLTINKSGSRLGKLKEIPLKVFGYDPVFFKYARRTNPSLVHAHFGTAAVVALPLARNLGVPLLTTFHGCDATIRPEDAGEQHYTFRLYWRKKHLLQQQGRMFIAVSQFIRDKMLEQGYPTEKILVHYIGVDIDFFRENPTYRRRPVVLFVGRLTEKKGCGHLIQAMQQLQSRRPEWELVVIGDGELRDKLQQSAAGCLSHFQFLGVQDQATIRHWMNTASIFCVPSTVAADGDAEGFGMVFAEAQAMRLPVVSFATGGVPEAVRHQVSGFLAPDRDALALAEYLETLAANPPLRQRMGEAGRERVVKDFNLSFQTRKLESIYEEVIDRASPN